MVFFVIFSMFKIALSFTVSRKRNRLAVFSTGGTPAGEMSLRHLIPVSHNIRSKNARSGDPAYSFWIPIL